MWHVFSVYASGCVVVALCSPAGIRHYLKAVLVVYPPRSAPRNTSPDDKHASPSFPCPAGPGSGACVSLPATRQWEALGGSRSGLQWMVQLPTPGERCKTGKINYWNCCHHVTYAVFIIDFIYDLLISHFPFTMVASPVFASLLEDVIDWSQ